jgi:2-polyprenyl-3-methyl-5-hydroxy-6-metoxy-1,4-benzoquinol methylase
MSKPESISSSSLSATNIDLKRCKFCDGSISPLSSFWDDRYGYPGRFAAWRCSNCGHICIDANMTPDQLTALYSNYYPRSAFDVEDWTPPRDVSQPLAWWRGLHASAYRWVPPNVRVLDIGCGFGESLGYHRNRGCDAFGVDADINILRVAARHGLQVKVGLFDANLWQASSFDVVTLDQVIEHVTEPVELLRGIWTVMKPGAILIVATPNVSGWGARIFGRRWIHWHVPYHQQFFTRVSISRAASAAGFSVESTKTITNSAWLGFQWCHLAAPAAEGESSEFWSANSSRSFSNRLFFGMSAVADLIGLNAAITRVFDACGLGDNRVFVLRKQST